MKTFLYFSYRAVLAFLLIAGFIFAFAPIMLLTSVVILVSSQRQQQPKAQPKPVRELSRVPALVVAR